MRRAVRRAAPLAYQHSRIIFPITRSACAGRPRRASVPPSPREAFPTTCSEPPSPPALPSSGGQENTVPGEGRPAPQVLSAGPSPGCPAWGTRNSQDFENHFCQVGESICRILSSVLLKSHKNRAQRGRSSARAGARRDPTAHGQTQTGAEKQQERGP